MATLPMLDTDHRNTPVLDNAALADLARQFRGEGGVVQHRGVAMVGVEHG